MLKGILIKPVIVLFYALFLSSMAHSQQVIESHHLNYKLHYQQNLNTNQVFKEIALANNISIRSIDLNYSIHLQTIINHPDDSPDFIEIRFVNDSLTGNTIYRGFDIAPSPSPDIADINIILTAGNKILDSVKATGFELFTGNSYRIGLSQLNFDNEYPDGIKISINNANYSEKGIDNFYKKITSINNYFAAEYILDSALNILHQINRDDHDLAQSVFNFLEINNLIGHLFKLQAQENFNALEFDPINFYGTLKVLKNRFSVLSNDYINGSTSENRKLINLEFAADKYFEQINKHLTNNTSSDKYFSALYYRMGYQNVSNSKLAYFYQIIKQLHNNEVFDFPIDKVIYVFTKHLYDEWLRSSNKYINDEKYSIALDLLNNLSDLCHYWDPCQISTSVFKATAQTKWGIYRSYIKIAEKAFEMDKQDLAIEYLSKANDFQNGNKEYIITNSAVTNHFLLLFNKNLNILNDHLAQDDINASIKMMQVLYSLNIDYLDQKESDTLLVYQKKLMLLLSNNLADSYTQALLEKDYAGAKKIIHSSRDQIIKESGLNETDYKNLAEPLLNEIDSLEYRVLLAESSQMILYRNTKEALSLLESASEITKKLI